MDVQKREAPSGFFTRRFWMREILCCAENKGAALFYGCLLFALGYLFAGTHALFGAYPFALALLAACNRRLPFALAGVCLGALTLGPRGYVYCAAYLLVLLLRTVVSRPREEGRIFPACYEYYDEAPALRAATACVGGFSLAMYQLAFGGIAWESLAFAAAMILLPTVLCAFYLGYFEDGRSLFAYLTDSRTAHPSWPLVLGAGGLAFGIVRGLSSFSFFGLSLSYCFAAFFCILLTQKWGLLRGGTAALFAALATFSPAYMPAFAALALLSALLRSFGLFYALAGACIGGVLTAFSLNGTQAMYDLMPEVVVSAALAWPLFKSLPHLSESAEADRRREKSEAIEEVRRRMPTLERMQLLSSAYRSLSEIFSRLSEVAERPSESEYAAAGHAAFARHCENCAGREGCWEMGEKNAARALACYAEQYARGTKPADIRLPESLMRSCGSFPQIEADVRSACAALEERKLRADRNGIFARNYAMMSEMLTDAARHEVHDAREDTALSREARRIFEEMGAPVRNVAVFGTRRRLIVADGVRWDATRHNEQELRGRLEEVCHCRLGPVVFESQNGGMRLRLESARRLTACVHQAAAPRGREVSGDAFSTFEGQGDYGYALLSDGMGSGREAAITAGICGAFLRQILAAGTSKSTALRALNTLLCEREGECSATIDLLELDLLYGKACFVKSGAAASYVKRGENLFRIRSNTVPIGILDALDAEQIRFDIQVGDVIVMFSDGISQSPDDATWLCELLTASAEEKDLDKLAARILSAAREHSEGGGDDMTVALIEVRAA